MHDWTPKQIAYMHDAVRFSDYYSVIAAHIAPLLPENAHLCDAGCGLGELGMALLPDCRSVICIDRSANAIADLQGRAPRGLTALCGDVEALPPETPYDAMVFCLFGSLQQTLRIAARQCSGRIFLVKRDYTHHRFSAGNVSLGGYNAENTARQLDACGIPYTSESFFAQLGQPLRSVEEAEDFLAGYNRTDTPFTRDEVERQLTAGPSEEFPYYLPHEKTLRLFVIDAAAVRQYEEGLSAKGVKCHLFLTGKKGVGKSTLVRRLTAGENPGGFCTVRVGDEKPAVYLLSEVTGREPTEENRLFICRSGSDAARHFDTLGVAALRGAAEYFVMDELGPHEGHAREFRRRVQELLEGDVPVLGVLQQAESDFLQEIARHPRVRVVEVTEENRDELFSRLRQWRTSGFLSETEE